MSGPYTVLILDQDDCELSNTEYGAQREAISMAREKINEQATSEYQDWCVARVIDAQGEIVWDKHRAACKVCGEWVSEDHPGCADDDLPEAGDIRETGR